MLKLSGWGLKPFKQYLLDPNGWSHTRRPLESDPLSASGYAGFAQVLRVKGRGKTMFAVFVHEGDIVLLIGTEARSLFEPGLKIENHQGMFTSELTVSTGSGETSRYRWRHTDWCLAIIDSTYDYLDYEIANLPPALPDLAARNREELVAEWTERFARPVKPAP